MPQEIPIDGETIRLGQLLKLVGTIDSGSEAKPYLASETVLVNDGRELRRGRQLHPGDAVKVGERQLLLTRFPPEKDET